jgi:hypothetical protein
VKSTISMLAATSLAAGLLLTQAACTDTTEEPAVENPALAAPVPDGMVRGTVLETMDSGGYTYVLLETDEDTRWAATQQTVVEVGDIVQVSEGMAMANFTSKTLDRTFDVVYFTGALTNLSKVKMPEGHPETALPSGHPDTESAAQPDAMASMDTAVAELEPGQNIAYVYANKDSLAGQQISLRGKVIKYNEGILGQNFIHLQDGSGDAASGNNDITITSQATTAVGETVIVTGTIILDKDFGAGYSFPVMIADATVTVE